MKYLKKHRRLLLISIVLVIVTSMFLVLNNSHVYHELPKVKLKGDVNNSGLAIMIEKDYKTGEYQKLDSNTFPTDGYTLNRIKSGCVDKNGNNIDALTYNESDKTISIKTKQSVYCYLYYDNLFKGSGTEDEPYQINYIEDLVRLSNSVNKDLNTYADKNFILMRDLDFNENASYMKYNDTGFGDINGVNNIEGIKEELTNKDGTGFIPIGNYSVHFQGNLNGNDKRLDNLYILNKSNSNLPLGLFGIVENSVIENLTISGNLNTEIVMTVGGFVGYTYGNVTIDNCFNEINNSSICGSYSVGGLVGDNYGNLTIKNSVNKGNISGGNNTGGLVGYITSNATLTIENSHNEGTITNELGGQVGGLLGRDDGTSAKTIIKNSYNIGEVTNSKLYEGGLAGLIKGTIEIYNSYNAGRISNDLATYVGGLVGGCVTSITINNSYNIGDIINLNTTSQRNLYFGGLVGSSGGIVNIQNSYNKGNIENSFINIDGRLTMNFGGLVGNLEGDFLSSIVNSYNEGKIINSKLNGGLIGYSNQDLIIDNCHNNGDITSAMVISYEVYGGGIIAQAVDAKVIILNSFNTGNIDTMLENTIYGRYANGIGLFQRSNVKIYNFYNNGNLTSMFNEGILYHDANSPVKIVNAFNLGQLSGPNNYEISYRLLEAENVYYLENTGAKAWENNIKKTQEEFKDSALVETLNQKVTELNNAGLETIDEDLKGYELNKWIQGSDDYPILTRKIIDLSGNDNHGISYAVKYDKEGIITSTDTSHLGYVDAGLINHEFNNSVSFAVRMKLNNKFNSASALIGNWDLPTGGGGISAVGFSLVLDGNNKVVYHNQDVKVGEWYTIIGTYDGNLKENNMKTYINGVKAAETTISGDILASSLPILIGGDPNIQNDKMGLINFSSAIFKEALVFDRALTEEKDHISTNYKDDINVTNQDELLVWYKF